MHGSVTMSTGTSTVCLCLVAIVCLVKGKEYYVSVDNGSDTNPGTITHPWQHVNKALSVLQPGDICTIRGGTYYEEVKIAGLMGTPDKPIVFRAQPGENVIFDGTGGEIKTTWTKYKGNIYQATLTEDIWQLFVDGEMQVNARWPNSFWYDFSVFDYTKWGFSDSNSTYDTATGFGVMSDNGTQGLQRSGINATGAIAILNIGSWKTYTGYVDKHQPYEPNFSYHLKKPVGGIDYHAVNCRYFLEDKLDFLDAATEWYYNNKTKQIYLWTKDSDTPENHMVSGKKSTYAFSIADGSSWLKLESLSFFATTVNIGGDLTEKTVDNIDLESCHFSYPSYSKRMLGSLDVPDMTQIYHNGDLTKEEVPSFRIFNCTFEYGDGQTINYRGGNSVIENNLWHHNDFTCVGDGSLFDSNGIRDTFIRNTVHSNGPSEGYQPGGISSSKTAPNNNVRLNMMYDLKQLQNDGAHIQTHINSQNSTVIQNNWCFDTTKFGIRFDREMKPGAPWGYNGTISHNVVWSTGGIMVKGDHHHVVNNLVFDSLGLNDMYLLGPAGTGTQLENNHTLAANNILQHGAGSCTAASKHPCPVLPGNFTNNAVNKGVQTLLRDPLNLDFRPVADSDLVVKGIGPYGKESVSHGGVYWIPGRQLLTASIPIPPNGTNTAKCNAHLMWLEGYKADSHDVYFGTNKELVTDADKSSPEFMGNMKAPSNIYDPSLLKPNKTYYWRVDAIQNNNKELNKEPNTVHKGVVWQFKCRS